ncbi:MAG: YceI family protein [Ignavibacteriae bacterium]|nr:YceI family protein [Ignavibacteriota bacterium]
MKQILAALLLVTALVAPAAAQRLSTDRTGTLTFNIKDDRGRNQASFLSESLVEDIAGTAAGLGGTVSFDPSDVAKTISATVTVDVASMKTGIDMRDEHLRSEGWLNAKQFPTIEFKLLKLKGAKVKNGTEINGTAVGTFTMHGVTKNMEMPVTLIYMKESEKTKARAAGDLLVVRAKGTVSLSDFGVKNQLVGQKVAENISFQFNAVANSGVK